MAAGCGPRVEIPGLSDGVGTAASLAVLSPPGTVARVDGEANARSTPRRARGGHVRRARKPDRTAARLVPTRRARRRLRERPRPSPHPGPDRGRQDPGAHPPPRRSHQLTAQPQTVRTPSRRTGQIMAGAGSHPARPRRVMLLGSVLPQLISDLLDVMSGHGAMSANRDVVAQ